MSELYMMVTITNRKYMSKFAALYRENQIEVGTVSLGMGTASSSILDYMGLEDDEKSICFHFVTAATWKKVKKGLQNQLRIDVPGTGIAFTIPMSSIGGKRELGFLIQGQEFVREEEGTLKETKHELIVAIANYGYTAKESLYKEAGSEVGTVTLNYKFFRFFGPTKEVTAPIVLSKDINLYNNDFNNDHAEILYKGEETNAWKLTGNKTVNLTLKVGQFEETVEGTITLTTGDLLKANLPLYGAALLFTVIVIVLIVVLIRIISMNKRRNRRNRYYR